MALPIFYIEKFDNTLVVLNEETSRHVIQVLRMKLGSLLQLTDGKGNLLTAEVTGEHKKHCTVLIKEHQFKPRNNRQVSIAISLLKNVSRFEWFLEKATEIGVSEIIPLRCERTEKQHFRFDRMNNIVIAAMLQSRQVWLPALHEPTAFNEVIEANGYPIKLVAHCLEEDKSAVALFKSNQSVQMLIGPEGDFSPGEIETALQADYKAVTLGNTRLRTETAGVVAASLLCVEQ